MSNSMRIEKVKLSGGVVAFLRIQTAEEYLDMGLALESIGQSEATNIEKIKQATALKIASAVCNEKGIRKFAVDAAPSVVLACFSWKDAKKLVAQVNKNNSVQDEDIEETEKK